MKSSAEVLSLTPSIHVPCYLCGADEPVTQFEAAPYRIVRCPRCSLVYTLPRLSPDQIKAMYQTAYWSSDAAKEFGYTDYLNDRELYLATYRLRREVITKRKPAPGRVLDVGSAAGYFLATMKEIGWECHGIELSEFMAAKSREAFGLEHVRPGSILDADYPPGHFDAITFWDVVEHLEDPLPHLERARSLLKDDGLLVIETQNVESAFARLMGAKWQHYKMAEHLNHFAPGTVAKLLERAGFEILENSPRRGGKKISFEFLVERAGRVHPVLSTLLSPLRLIGRASIYVNLFDEMIVVARRGDRRPGSPAGG
jgi:2-polyprenyl-3-methyl-5-hydroxy-6-metoxy-1,4-benzoquinol methylase